MALPLHFVSASNDAKALADFQRLVSRCRGAALRKELIVTARCCGAIDEIQTELLIQTYQLETA